MSYARGRHSYGELDVRTWDRTSDVVVGGNFCSIGPNVKVFVDGNHHIDTFSTFPFHIFPTTQRRQDWSPWGKATPTIGHDVWIGADVLILSGASIGDGAVVAARSVVTKPVPPYAVVAGNPARVVKYRFDDATIRDLLDLKWWDLPDEVILQELVPLGADIAAVVQRLKVLRGKMCGT
jgi:acetyltransferase-like isoleucine patch superfamily enzyme